ncbi:helix-turn-helix transcriptional regulator [uncultured Planktomarina sp.]|uniref:helix-turn-helix domain-containing protein n=1 Tax=uncultured Planktomarina sp. TaxID=1538529 RepID=UPI003261BB81
MTGAELRKLRSSLGATQEEIAPLLGMSGPSGKAKISDMERGVRPIPWKTAQLMLCYDRLSPFSGSKLELAKHIAAGNKEENSN